MKDSIEKIALSIKRKIRIQPEIAIILGSGLGGLTKNIENPVSIPYASISGFPRSAVKGHANTLIAGIIAGTPVLLFSGRFHYYEGFPMKAVTLPVKLTKALGISKLLVTNAAGGIRSPVTPPSIMIISDHINLMGTNPLIGTTGEPRFPDMSHAYSPTLRALLLKAAKISHVRTWSGIYAGMSGPSYETPAEIKMLKKLGAGAVGMSTVPEVIMAKKLGLDVAGFSVITNLAAGLSKRPLNHEEVIEASRKISADTVKLVTQFIKICNNPIV